MYEARIIFSHKFSLDVILNFHFNRVLQFFTEPDEFSRQGTQGGSGRCILENTLRICKIKSPGQRHQVRTV